MWYRACFAEALGCALFHVIGSVAILPAANGVALTALVYLTAKLSGAHLNPAVTLAFGLLGHSRPDEVLAYWVSQVTGAILGSFVLASMVPGLAIGAEPASIYSGCPSPSVPSALVFGWEALGTFGFVLPVMSVVWYTQNKKGYGNTGPIVVGVALTANALACAPFTGGVLNPARAIASSVTFACSARPQVYAYVLGELTGAAMASLVTVPWYGISRSPWYGTRLPKWVHLTTRDAHRSIKLETTRGEGAEEDDTAMLKQTTQEIVEAYATTRSKTDRPSSESRTSSEHMSIALQSCK